MNGFSSLAPLEEETIFTTFFFFYLSLRYCRDFDTLRYNRSSLIKHISGIQVISGIQNKNAAQQCPFHDGLEIIIHHR